MESIVRFLKSFWQPVIVAVLSLILIAQLIGWGYAALQMRGIDRLVAAAQEEAKPTEASAENPQQKTQGNPGESRNPGDMRNRGDRGNRGNRGNPAGPGGQGNPELKISADIFFRRAFNYELSAIYKDQAVINGQEVKAGQRIGNATLQEIRLASVLIHEDGQPAPRELVMFQGAGGGGPSMGGPPPGRGPEGGGRPSAASAPVQAAPQGGGMVMSPPGGGSRDQRMEFMQRMRNGTFNPNDLTPEQRQRFEEMRQRRSERRGQGGGESGEGPPPGQGQ
ncbi:MAG TPA: hypothetical protein PLZ55_15490 [bacterium]|nr:hypothetical protein [bacterium]HPO10078.1 hypothetical protein [bacterium]HQO33754.1 hypothetical protein [bacterium]HQP99033.1 hypothetical protein [bacterium]